MLNSENIFPNISKESVSATIDALVEIFLQDPATPESSKIELRIMQVTRKVEKVTRGILLRYATPYRSEEARKAAYDVRKDVLEYLQMVAEGMENFLATHPAPRDSV